MSCVRILLAEDDLGHQHLIRKKLISGREGVEVETVTTGRELLRTLQYRTFDCILLDFNLPDFRADEILSQLAQEERDAPIIVISSSQDQHTVISSMRSGSVDFLPKMEVLEGDNLWRRIEVALGKRRKASDERRRMRRRIQRLARLAESDPLTGLANRYYLDRLVREGRDTYDRRGQVACIMLDVDNFKTINDRLGHAAGDQVLRALAEAVRVLLSRDDTACRWGGEEFLLVKSCGSRSEVLIWAEQLRKRIEHLHVTHGGLPIRISASLGVTLCTTGHVDDEAISGADGALYLAKRRGRNQVCTAEMVGYEQAAQQIRATGEPSLATRLRRVIEHCRPLLGPTQHEHLTSHSQRVGAVSARLGQRLGLQGETLRSLQLAGLYHDLGKMVIPEDLLGKPTSPTADERGLLDRHAAYGADMSMSLGMGAGTAEWVRCHHIQYDGSNTEGGYRGAALPMEARILHVADALAAMTSDRPYRPARSTLAAMRELYRGCHIQFDPEVVDAAHTLLAAGSPVETLCSI